MASGNDTYTKILLHFNGSDASTTITDDNAGGSAHTWTANGDAQLDTAIAHLGTAALLCDGSGDYIDTPDHSDFTLGSGPWTVDFWFNTNGVGNGTNRRAFGHCGSANTSAVLSIIGGMGTDNLMKLQVSDGSATTIVPLTTTITSSGWHHFAGVRSGNNLKVFLDGVQEGGDIAFVGSVVNPSAAFAVGRRGEVTGSEWRGSIDEFRLSVGIARWTTNFTPPTDEYAAAQIITAALFTNTNTFFASVTTSLANIDGALFDDPDTFFAALIVTPAPQTITGVLATDDDTFFTSIVDVADPQSITGALVVNTSVFFRSSNIQGDGPSTDITRLYNSPIGYKRWFWTEAAKRQIRASLRRPPGQF